MRSGPLAKNTRLGPMRKLASGPYSRAVSSKKSSRRARNWRLFPPTIVPFGPGGSPDRIDATAVLIKIYGVSTKAPDAGFGLAHQLRTFGGLSAHHSSAVPLMPRIAFRQR